MTPSPAPAVGAPSSGGAAQPPRMRRRMRMLVILRRRRMSLGFKLVIPSLLGMIMLLALGATVGLAFLSVSAEARLEIVENARSADAARLQIETRSLMDTAQSALNNDDPAALARLFQQRNRLRAAITDARRDLASLPPADQARLDAVNSVLEPLDNMAALLQRGFPDVAQGQWDHTVYDQLASGVSAAAEFRNSSALRARAAAQRNLDAIAFATVLSLVVVGLALLMLPLIGWMNHALVVTPIQEVTSAMTRVASGDLSGRLDLDHNDELGQLETSFNDMTTALNILLDSARSGEIRPAGPGSALLVSAQAAAGRVVRNANELEQAYRIQSALLPPSHHLLPGWNLVAARIPATELGGDFYDLLNLSDGRLGLIIGDVSGHGAASALIAAWTQGMMALAAADEADPGIVLARVNALLYARLPPRMFVTLGYAVLDPRNDTLLFANAGHPFPLIRFYPETRPAGANGHTSGWTWIEQPGLPLGSFPDATYDTKRFPLHTVDGVILYSDGIVEARDSQGVFYGFERLQALCDRLAAPLDKDIGGSSRDEAPSEAILRSALTYAGTPRPEDDMTVLVVRRYAPEAAVAGPLDSADNRYLAPAGG
jgi:serine phosphatase RsbU (regulator of sigma subunit)/HAMP domain-containing protein